MSPAFIEIAPISSPLPPCSPNLMPFHIDYSGPAPISTYFRDKPASSRVATPAVTGVDPENLAATLGDDNIPIGASVGGAVVTTSLSGTISRDGNENGDGMKNDIGVVGQGTSPPETNKNPSPKVSLWRNISNSAARFVAAFRGRTVHGLQVDVPEGYVGLVLRGEGDVNGQTISADVMMASTAMSRRRNKSGGRGKRDSAKAMDVDSNGDGRDGNTGVDVEGDLQADTFTGELEGDEPRRTLIPAGGFSSFVLWHPDNPVEEGKDEYYRSLIEWTKLASQIHHCEP